MNVRLYFYLVYFYFIFSLTKESVEKLLSYSPGEAVSQVCIMLQWQKPDENQGLSDLLCVPCLKIKHRRLGGSTLIPNRSLCKHSRAVYLFIHLNLRLGTEWLVLVLLHFSFVLKFLSLQMLKMKSNRK